MSDLTPEDGVEISQVGGLMRRMRQRSQDVLNGSQWIAQFMAEHSEELVLPAIGGFSLGPCTLSSI